MTDMARLKILAGLSEAFPILSPGRMHERTYDKIAATIARDVVHTLRRASQDSKAAALEFILENLGDMIRNSDALKDLGRELAKDVELDEALPVHVRDQLIKACKQYQL